MMYHDFLDIIPIKKENILDISFGIQRSPEGTTGHVLYGGEGQYKWFEIGIRVNEDVALRIIFTTKNPDELKVDGVFTQIIDLTGQYGYGPKYESKFFTKLDVCYHYLKTKDSLSALMSGGTTNIQSNEFALSFSIGK